MEVWFRKIVALVSTLVRESGEPPEKVFLSCFSVKMATDTDISAASVSGIDIPVMLRGGCGVTVSDYEIPPSPLFPDFLGCTHAIYL